MAGTTSGATPPATWLTADEIRQRWAEAAEFEDDSPLLDSLVVAAQEQCIEYAPALPEGEPVPESWRLAHQLQTQALWQSVQSGPGDQIGPDGMTVTVYPMDRIVKRLLRPERAVPVIA